MYKLIPSQSKEISSKLTQNWSWGFLPDVSVTSVLKPISFLNQEDEVTLYRHLVATSLWLLLDHVRRCPQVATSLFILWLCCKQKILFFYFILVYVFVNRVRPKFNASHFFYGRVVRRVNQEWSTCTSFLVWIIPLDCTFQICQINHVAKHSPQILTMMSDGWRRLTSTTMAVNKNVNFKRKYFEIYWRFAVFLFLKQKPVTREQAYST